ncbi:uncharacterized protein LOC128276367 [Anopheles cruzii]|uniref:uncharacterized protein LOC128276367 n=1 Tax=Anopheles cruzii TaxID=68878 RepID=UPI0022EC56E8|nr:uncharacterized protein LOC128276367 [Anopheles cruzii]
MKFLIIFAVGMVSVASASSKEEGKQKVSKRGLWHLGTYYSGFGDSLARSDDGHGGGGGASLEHHFGGGGGWGQDSYQPHQVQQWSQAAALHGEQDFKQSHPVHEWQAEQDTQHGPALHFQQHHQQPHFGGAGSFHFQNLQQQDHHGFSLGSGSGSSSWPQHDEEANQHGSLGTSHGGWAPIVGGGDELHQELSEHSHTQQTEKAVEQQVEWSAPASAAGEGKEHQPTEEHHGHTKIIKVPYPVHIEKPYPVYIEKPFIVEKPVPLKLYIKKKKHD